MARRFLYVRFEVDDPIDHGLPIEINWPQWLKNRVHDDDLVALLEPEVQVCSEGYVTVTKQVVENGVRGKLEHYHGCRHDPFRDAY